MEQIALGMEVTGIGLTVVFILLYVLYLIVLLFGKLFFENKPVPEPQITKPQSITSSSPVQGEDTEVLAVINAAIMAYLQQPSSATEAGEAFLPVTRNKKNKWSASGRWLSLQARRELTILRRRK